MRIEKRGEIYRYLDIFVRKDLTGFKNLSGLSINDLRILKYRQTNFVQ
jgi:hypothetical protein